MTRSILCGLLALVSVGAMGLVPVACQSGGIGDPCTPEDEYKATFSGFNVAEANIESRSFQCSTRICLVNHFQGRVSCPQGQDAKKIVQCTGLDDKTHCTAPKECVAGQVFSPTCNVCAPSATDPTKQADPNCVPQACTNGLVCDKASQVCTCTQPTVVDGIQYSCEPSSSAPGAPSVLTSFICHERGVCQTAAAGTTGANTGKDCCIPGTDIPVGVSVCGQCSADTERDANDAVYCSARCCVPCCAPGVTPDTTNPTCSTDTSICGPACDPNFNYQSCPTGFTCTGINTNLGIADPQLTGAYCIKSGSVATTTNERCGTVVGYADINNCQGLSTTAPTPTTDGGM